MQFDRLGSESEFHVDELHVELRSEEHREFVPREHQAVSKAYQELVDENLVEKRRGLGMYVTDGARDALLKSERERFLREEWPTLSARLDRLGLSLKELMAALGKEESR